MKSHRTLLIISNCNMIGRRGELEKNEPYIQSESQIGVIYCYFYRSETFLCCSLRITLFFYVGGRVHTLLMVIDWPNESRPLINSELWKYTRRGNWCELSLSNFPPCICTPQHIYMPPHTLNISRSVVSYLARLLLPFFTFIHDVCVFK